MRVLLWLATFLGGVLGALWIGLTLQVAESSPQEASGFALGIAFGVVPYVVARAWDELAGKPARAASPRS